LLGKGIFSGGAAIVFLPELDSSAAKKTKAPLDGEQAALLDR
jgi:hypothetical protein